MNQPLEPSYLRYVYDHLENGSITSDNASALPQGFIGLYEQEFEANTPVYKRQEVLQQLATFALLKTAVSTRFVASILGTTEEVIEGFIQNYSTWFNSTESGIYVLYHDRLRIYLLQKLSKKEVLRLNEQIIAVLEISIETQKTDESEYYALQHLAAHMSLASELGKDYERLHRFVNQESLWQRQIKLSKGYEWSQHAVQQGIKEGARRAHEMNTIRSTVNSVKLMTQEQNSAEDILNLLNDGDYITALKRAEIWEGERQFKLYLLFIHELTIGTSKEADFRKEACKAVLEAIDQTPEDHSILDWCEFYPELAVYKYHEELLEMELDGLRIWRRGDYNLKDIMSFERKKTILIHLLENISNERNRFNAFKEFYEKYVDQNDIEEENYYYNIMLKITLSKTNIIDQSESFMALSILLFSNGKILEAIEMAKKIKAEKYKSHALIKLYASLRNIKTNINRNSFYLKSLKIAFNIEDKVDQADAFIEITNILFEEDNFENIFQVLSKIKSDYTLSKIHLNIAKKFLGKKDFKKALESINKAIVYTKGIKDDLERYLVIQEIGPILIRLKRKKDAIDQISLIKDNIIESLAYSDLAIAMLKLGEVDESHDLILKKVSHLFRSGTLADAVKILVCENKLNEALQIAYSIDEMDAKSLAFNYICLNLYKNRKLELFLKVSLKSLKYESIISNNDLQSSSYNLVADKLLNQGKFQEALNGIMFLQNELDKSNSLIFISESLLKKNLIDESYEVINKIDGAYKKCEALINLANFFHQKSNFIEAQKIVHKIKELISEININYYKNTILANLAILLIKIDELNESINTIRQIDDCYIKMNSEILISQELYNKGLLEEFENIMAENKDKVLNISDGRQYKVLISMSHLLFICNEDNQSEKLLDKSIELVSKVDSVQIKCEAILNIYDELILQNKETKAIKLIKEAIIYASQEQIGSLRIKIFEEFGKFLNNSNFNFLLEEIKVKEDLKAFIKGISSSILASNSIKFDNYPYLYHHSKYTENLSNILFHQAKIACFFEKERNEEKLDVLSEVLDIEDWRSISA